MTAVKENVVGSSDEAVTNLMDLAPYPTPPHTWRSYIPCVDGGGGGGDSVSFGSQIRASAPLQRPDNDVRDDVTTLVATDSYLLQLEQCWSRMALTDSNDASAVAELQLQLQRLGCGCFGPALTGSEGSEASSSRHAEVKPEEGTNESEGGGGARQKRVKSEGTTAKVWVGQKP